MLAYWNALVNINNVIGSFSSTFYPVADPKYIGKGWNGYCEWNFLLEANCKKINQMAWFLAYFKSIFKCILLPDDEEIKRETEKNSTA